MKILQNKIEKLVVAVIPIVFLATQVSAQMGVGTLNPTNPVEIKTNATTTEKNVIVDNTGKVGVLVAAPKVAMDLRSSGTNGSVAIGNTDQTASAAGAGAVRYVNSPAIGVKGYLEFSDGTNWVGFFPYGKPRLVVMANKTTQDTEVFEGPDASTIPKAGIMQRRSSYLINWAEKLDTDSGVTTGVNNFNPATGEFTAPRAGVYFATFTYALQLDNVNTGSNNQTEAIWEVRNSADVITQRVKTNNGYSSDSGAGTGNRLPVGSACTVSVYLNQGDKLRPFVWITVQFDGVLSQFNISNSGEYNALTIVEQ